MIAFFGRQRAREQAATELMYLENKQDRFQTNANDFDEHIHMWQQEMNFITRELLFYVDDKKPRTWVGFFLSPAVHFSEYVVPPRELGFEGLTRSRGVYCSVHDVTRPMPPYHRWFGRKAWPIDSAWLDGDTRDYLTNVRGFDRYQAVPIYPGVRDFVMEKRGQLAVTASTHQVLYAFVVDGIFADEKAAGTTVPIRLSYDQSTLENTIAVCVELMLHQQYMRIQRRGKVMSS
jgi:hypothetical protein